ncbi:MAG: helix-turn-helix domain-containing protein [Dehalococcoidales bacterium]|nr:helix-turn-helix domain-containing protein [Dehalococcoidales bacterium]
MERQKQIGRLLKDAREARGWGVREYARRFGCAHSAIAAKERGEQDLSLSELERHAELLGVSIDYFLKGAPKAKRHPDAIIDELRQTIREQWQQMPPHARVPLYNQALALGSNGKLAIDNLEVADYIMYPHSEWKPSLGAAKTDGSCLTGIIESGDIVIFDTELQSQNGDYVVCTHKKPETDEWETGVKRFRHVNDHQFIEDNERSYTLEDCRILGVVVKVIHDFLRR